VTGSLHARTNPGDLYFYPLGQTTFTVEGLGTGESNMLNLDTDALLRAANAFGGPTQVALQARGSMRANIAPGKTGVVSFADLYRAAPLGVDPITGTPGYPLLRFILMPAQLRAALEGTLLKSGVEDPDFYVSPAGLIVKYDRTRAMWDQTPTGAGWITYMATVAADGTESWLYDVNRIGTIAGFRYNPGDLANPANFIPVAATYQLGVFAASLGITPIDPATGVPVVVTDGVADVKPLIVRYPASTCAAPGPCASVKDHQALGQHVYAITGGGVGNLPSIYDATTTAGHIPRRMVCEGAACP
jgi:hypothetical protein